MLADRNILLYNQFFGLQAVIAVWRFCNTGIGGPAFLALPTGGGQGRRRGSRGSRRAILAIGERMSVMASAFCRPYSSRMRIWRRTRPYGILIFFCASCFSDVTVRLPGQRFVTFIIRNIRFGQGAPKSRLTQAIIAAPRSAMRPNMFGLQTSRSKTAVCAGLTDRFAFPHLLARAIFWLRRVLAKIIVIEAKRRTGDDHRSDRAAAPRRKVCRRKPPCRDRIFSSRRGHLKRDETESEKLPMTPVQFPSDPFSWCQAKPRPSGNTAITLSTPGRISGWP